MSTVFFVLAIVCALATLASLFVGILGMGREAGREAGLRGNRIMRWRILLQAATIGFIVLWWLSK